MITNLPQLANLRAKFQSLSVEQQKDYIKHLDKETINIFYLHPELTLFDKQIIPEGDWRYCMFRCGRRFGKSVSGSAWIAQKVINGSKSLGLCGEDYSAVRDVMVKNVLSWFPRGEAKYLGGDQHKIVFTNRYKGAEIYCYTSDKEIRGPSLEYLWCDEIANWCDRQSDKIRIRFDSVDTAVSVGKHPQTIITSTPRSFQLFFDFQQQIEAGNKNYIILTGTMFDNPYLSDGFRQKELDKYKDDPARLKQEIYGELVFEDPAALFQMSWIDKARIIHPDNPQRDNKKDLTYFFSQVSDGMIQIKRIVIAVDPAVTNGKTSDETGIMVLAQDFKGEMYLLGDYSERHTPDAWSKQVRNLFNHYKKHFLDVKIIAETNQGGDLVVSNLCAADHTLFPFIKKINASKGKLLRAEPVAAKYQRNKVHHVGHYSILERQMTNYTGDKKQGSPDHMDALVHGINELTIVAQYSKRDLSPLSGY